MMTVEIGGKRFDFSDAAVAIGGAFLQSQSSSPRELKLEKFGPGPWVDEPDRVEWRHEGFPCLIRRAPLGALCGYVAVPREHPWYGLHYDHIPAEAHGGLTYAEACAGEICHVPQPGEPDDVWWIGFDCSHYMDLTPELAKISPRSVVAAGGTYRDVAYVHAEVLDLAEQIASVPVWTEYRERLENARTRRQRKQAAVYAAFAHRHAHRRKPHPERLKRERERFNRSWRRVPQKGG